MSEKVYRVRDMVSLPWGRTEAGDRPAHILRSGPLSSYWRTECGVYVVRCGRDDILDALVCKRCLKATEKYA